jgi:hypothetical protein
MKINEETAFKVTFAVLIAIICVAILRTACMGESAR